MKVTTVKISENVAVKLSVEECEFLYSCLSARLRDKKIEQKKNLVSYNFSEDADMKNCLHEIMELREKEIEALEIIRNKISIAVKKNALEENKHALY